MPGEGKAFKCTAAAATCYCYLLLASALLFATALLLLLASALLLPIAAATCKCTAAATDAGPGNLSALQYSVSLAFKFTLLHCCPAAFCHSFQTFQLMYSPVPCLANTTTH